MPFASANGLDICYEVIGEDDGEPMLLITGLGAQLLAWPDEFCLSLADRGFRIVRFDNRDCGLSQKFESDIPDGGLPEAIYSLDDMAHDAAGLLDALEITSAHVVGISMGGMIAQLLAIHHPHRVTTLTSMAAHTSAPGVGQSTPEALAQLREPPVVGDREAVIAQSVSRRLVWSSPEYVDVPAMEAYQAACYDRSHYPEGTIRQLAAIMAAQNREHRLAELGMPTLVVHGALDPLVGVDGGERTAEVIPDAELLIIEDLAHDLPAPHWPAMIEGITRLAQRALH